MSSEIKSTGPKLLPSRIGLLPEHFQLLESPEFRLQPPAQIAQGFARLRELYAGNFALLKHLDVYDLASQYQAKMDELNNAWQMEDNDKKTQIKAWLTENYPNIDYADVIPIEDKST